MVWKLLLKQCYNTVITCLNSTVKTGSVRLESHCYSRLELHGKGTVLFDCNSMVNFAGLAIEFKCVSTVIQHWKLEVLTGIQV